VGRVAAIIYGNGHTLGKFEVFAGSLAKTLRLTYGHGGVLIQKIVRRDEFFSYIAGPPTLGPTDKIAEIHVFAHSIGGGLFIAYGDETIDHRRQYLIDQAAHARRRITYREVLDTESGAILTDDFVRSPYREKREAVRRNLTDHAAIKLWGCNAGVQGWVYTDGDPEDVRTAYYWRALNEQNVPKPAVAQAFADYFGRICWGGWQRLSCRGYEPWSLGIYRAVSPESRALAIRGADPPVTSGSRRLSCVSSDAVDVSSQ